MAGLFVLAVRGGFVALDTGSILVDLIWTPWIAGPALAAAAMVFASATRAGAAAFLILELLCVGTTFLAMAMVTFASQSPYDGLGVLLLPFAQWLLFALFLVAAILAGWRDRDAPIDQEPRNTPA